MDLKVIVGPGCSSSLSEGIQSKIAELTKSDFQLTVCTETDFADGAVLTQIDENIRGADVYIVQSTPPPERNFMVLLQMLQAASLASAGRVTAVLPYIDIRQDRKDRPRVPITAALRLQAIEQALIAASHKHVMFLHPHFPQVQGMVRLSTDVLYPTSSFLLVANDITGSDFSQVLPVAPDVGAAKLAAHYHRRLGTGSYAIGDKRRSDNDQAEIKSIIGWIVGRTAFIYDDIIDTAGSIKALAAKLRELGVDKIYVFATHGILAGKAIANLQSAGIEKVFITDSISHDGDSLPSDLIQIVPCGELLGEAIWRNNTNRSIHAIDGMFDR
ncbi:ribose-phosphate diphosphokinase [Patescibacteria group bacterium]|nr:ribose-phosphate diphosphokinase [Patescibacteria group bacterium]MBU0963558.1 ribose-phosphate diphosphokinase [Patescibacteria group bacterium]